MMIRPTNTAKLAGITLAFLIAAVACSSPGTAEPAAKDSANTSVPVAATSESSISVADKEATVIAEATGVFFLEMTSPETSEVFVNQASYEFSGRTTVDALVSVNDFVLEVDEEGRFAFAMDLEEGPNVVEVVASNPAGEQQDEVLLVIYEPA